MEQLNVIKNIINNTNHVAVAKLFKVTILFEKKCKVDWLFNKETD